MATYSNNTTLKVNAAVSASSSRNSNGTTTIYTAPANSYALLQFNITGSISATSSITVGGQQIQTGTTVVSSPVLFYVGPGQAVNHVVSGYSGGGPIVIQVSGVEFKNTP